MRPPRGPAGRGRPSPCPAVSALGGAGRPPGTREPGSGLRRGRGPGVRGPRGCQVHRALEPGRWAGRGLAGRRGCRAPPSFALRGALLNQRLPGEPRGFAVGTANVVAPGGSVWTWPGAAWTLLCAGPV